MLSYLYLLANSAVIGYFRIKMVLEFPKANKHWAKAITTELKTVQTLSVLLFFQVLQ